MDSDINFKVFMDGKRAHFENTASPEPVNEHDFVFGDSDDEGWEHDGFGEGEHPTFPLRISGKDKTIHALTALAALSEPSFAEDFRSAVAHGRRAYNDKWVAKMTPLVPTNHLSAQIGVAIDRLRSCGQGGAKKCGSRWCRRCRSKLAYGMKARVTEASGGLLAEAQRESFRAVTVLNELVLPPPITISTRGFLEDAYQDEASVSSPSMSIKTHLKRQQTQAREFVCTLLRSKKISPEHILKLERPANTPLRSQFDRDVAHLELLNGRIHEIHGHVNRLRRFRKANGIVRDRLKGKHLPLYVPLKLHLHPNDTDFVVRDFTDAELNEMQQFLGAETLTKNEIFKIAREMQKVRNDYDKLDFSRYPDFIRFETTVKKALKRGRHNLNRIQKALPKLKMVGSFELELIDLEAALSPALAASNKSTTLKLLAKQVGSNVKTSRPSAVAMRQFFANISQGNLQELNRAGVRYAVLVHLHAIAVGNENDFHDLDRILAGKSEVSKRRFKALFPAENQVRVTRLHTTQDVEQNISNISDYCFKAQKAFKFDFVKCATQERVIPFLQLGLLIWLYHVVSERSLGFTMGMGDDLSLAKGKARRKARSLADDIPNDREAYIAIASNGSPQQQRTAARLTEWNNAGSGRSTRSEMPQRNVAQLNEAFEMLLGE